MSEVNAPIIIYNFIIYKKRHRSCCLGKGNIYTKLLHVGEHVFNLSKLRPKADVFLNFNMQVPTFYLYTYNILSTKK